MKYLCLIYQDERLLERMSQGSRDALMAETLAYDEELRGSGHLIASNTLECGQPAISLRVRGNTLAIVDGPFIDATEQLDGYILIEARDLNEAIRVAARMPPARTGGIEVRPVNNLAAWYSAVRTGRNSQY